MTFFNPFRKNAKKPEERREPSREFKRDGAEEGVAASDEAVLGSEAPAPWDPVNPEPALPTEPSGSDVPPAFEEVPHPAMSAGGDAPEAYDPYGIAAQEKALRERDEAVKKVEEKTVAASASADEPVEAASEAASEAVRKQKKPHRSCVSAEPDWPRRELTEEEMLARRRTKHRLIGAAALLLAVVVAAHFVLDSEGDFDSSSISTDIPAVSETSTTLDVPPAEFADSVVGAETFAGDAKLDMPKDVANAVQDQKVEEKSAVKPSEETAEKPADKKDAKPAVKVDVKSDEKTAQKTGQKQTKTAKKVDTVGIAPPEGKGFYVQVIATSSELEAERTVKKLALMGLPAYRVPVQTRAATLWRVRVGLYKTRKEADGVMGTIVLNGIASKPMVGSQ